MIDPNIESNTENYSPLEVTGQMEIFLYISKFIKNKLCRKLHLSSSHFRCQIIQSQYIRITKYPWAKTKGRNGIVRPRKKRISPLLLNIFLFGNKSHNCWSHSFQNILRFYDFVNIWYEKTQPE